MLRFLVFILSAFATLGAEKVGPALPQAHAHNDYEHTRPLLDALSHGFTSVEADIYLVERKLLVAHDREDLKPERTLRALYLDPLRELPRAKKRIFESGETLTLLIDIKTEAEPTYAVLREVLDGYREMLTHFEKDKMETNAVTVILSGNRPGHLLMSDGPTRLAGIDGRLAEVTPRRNLSASWIPLVSDNWNNHFKWRGNGALPDDEREKLRSLVQQIHSEGRRIRFCATPDNESAWAELRRAGVDLINTDKLNELAEFLRRQSP